MRKIIAGLNISIDGFTQGPNGEMDWLNIGNPDGWKDRHADLMQQLKSADTFLLGRVTYQEFEQYWPAARRNPSSTQFERELANFVEDVQKIVISKTLSTVQWNNSRLIKDNVAEEIAKLKREPGKNILAPGGAGMISTLTDLDLLDEYNLLVNPVVLGKGKHLFKDVHRQRNLKLVKTRTLDSQIVALTYERR